MNKKIKSLEVGLMGKREKKSVFFFPFKSQNPRKKDYVYLSNQTHMGL